MTRKTKPLMDRMMAKVTIEDAPDACWVWQGGTNNLGYGMIRLGKKMTTTHRVAAAAAGLNIEDKNVLHTCRNHACVNPDHLFTGDSKDVYDEIVKAYGRHAWTQLPGTPKPRIQCPHCARTMPPNLMRRHHTSAHPNIKY